jgi:hypothetical protein
MDNPSHQAFARPFNPGFSESDDESISSAMSGLSLVSGGGQDRTYSQHLDDPTTQSNPAGNPTRFDSIHMQKVNREILLKNLDKLDNVDLIRLSRSSYLKHANRYRVHN